MKDFTKWKIEDNTCEKGTKAKWHLEKWSKLNGKVPDGFILFYENARRDDFGDLILLPKSEFNTRLDERERKEKETEKKQEKEKGMSVLNALKKRRNAVYTQQEKKINNFLKTYKQKSLAEASEEEKEKGKVPVRLDHKTIVFLKKEECIKKDGKWIKKNIDEKDGYEGGYDWSGLKK